MTFSCSAENGNVGHGSPFGIENGGWRLMSPTSHNMASELPSISRRSLCRQLSQLLPLLFYLLISSGCATQEASNRNQPLSGAQLSLDEARKTKSDPVTAVGHYLDAAETALRLTSSTSDDEATNARLTYDSA